MVKMEVRCYYKDSKDKIIGAEVTVHNKTGDVIDRILVTDNHGLEELRSKLDNLDETYVDKKELVDALKDNVFGEDNIEVNATTFDGKDSSQYSMVDHNHENQFAPFNHQSNNDEYGAGTTDKFGHVKVRDNLDSRNLVLGEALSSRQGYVLNQRLISVEESSDELVEQYYRNSLRINIGRWSDNAGEESSKIQINEGSGDGIYAKIYCDKPDYSVAGKEVILVLNGIPYARTTDNDGKTGKLTINLSKGNYLLTAFRGGYGGVYATSDQKIIQVI